MSPVSSGAVREAEVATIRAFVVASRRQRWIEALDSPDRRQKTVRLHDARDFDARWTSAVARPEHSKAIVLTLLRGRGAPDRCFLMEEAPDPTREMALEDALTVVFDEGQWGSLIICIPGALAYQECEGHALIHDNRTPR